MEGKNIRIEETQTEKLASWLKDNIINIVLLLVCVVFIFKDLAQIERTDKTIDEIIADSLINLVMGFLITAIIGKKGIISGLFSSSVINMKAKYNDVIDLATPNLERLDGFCDFKNNQRLKRIQTSILRRVRIKYEDFIKEDYDISKLSKEDYKIYKKAKRVKMQPLTPDNLLSETTDEVEKGRLGKNLRNYEVGQNTRSLGSKAVFALIFGYYLLTLNEYNLANILWCSIQVSVWLLMGFMQYMTNYFYVTNIYKNDIIRKINHLEEFNNTIKKDNNAFKEEQINDNNSKEESQSI